MVRTKVLFLSVIASFCLAAHVMAQDNTKEIVVVMKRNYTYEDPRWSQPVTLEKGEAIKVMSDGSSTYDYWPYPAANVGIPKEVTRLPGSNGERYLQVNGTNVRLRKGPSTNYGYYCYNAANTASVYHNQFIHDNKKPKTDDWGLAAEWVPYYLPKGIRLPYLGKEKGFYKTMFNGTQFYISAKFCLLKTLYKSHSK